MSYAKTGVTLKHQKRDCINIAITHKGIHQIVLATYDQAYDLKQQLESFLGPYRPENES